MDADRWRRVEELFHAASRLAPAGRARLLDESCRGDAALRAEVESLLGYATTSDGFIETPASDVAARMMAGDLAAATVSLTGMTIGHFRILDKLGEGGMGVVYEAEDTRLGRKVALKFLPAPVVATPAAIERFEREARAASALNHPNICTIYSVQDQAGRPFIEMERLEGETLRERLARGKLPIDELIALSLQVSDALGAAHAGGIVHRDLTPGNVFCTPRGAKILDFGIAKLASTPDDTGAIVGTAGYMSPEQASGQPVDARTDLFSLGALMYEMATGQAAFQGPSGAAIRQAIIDADPIPPRRLDAGIPAALERVILKALQKSQAERYQSARELRDQLQPLAHRGTRRRRAAAAAAAVVLLAVAGAIAYWYAPRTDRDLFSTNLRLRQITRNTNEYSVRGGSISPDGRFVVYSDIRGLHLITMDTGDTRRVPMPEGIADGASWDLQPGWLPDGSGYLVNLYAGTAASIWTGGLAQPPRKLRDAAWAMAVSPDGSWIAFATARGRTGDRDMWIMKPDGTGARKLFEAPAGTVMRGVSTCSPCSPSSISAALLSGTTAT
jgi:serine/threonine protein kinase